MGSLKTNKYLSHTVPVLNRSQNVNNPYPHNLALRGKRARRHSSREKNYFKLVSIKLHRLKLPTAHIMQ